jgi:hypothetical protein
LWKPRVATARANYHWYATVQADWACAVLRIAAVCQNCNKNGKGCKPTTQAHNTHWSPWPVPTSKEEEEEEEEKQEEDDEVKGASNKEESCHLFVLL